MHPHQSNGTLAQMVEQWTENPCVPGSIPGGTTETRIAIFGFFVLKYFIMHYLYIIYSKSADKFYVGETYDAHSRIAMHNSHTYANSFTKIAGDWETLLSLECNDETEAKYLELFIKKMKSKNFIKKVITEPAILTDILSKR